MACLEGQSPAMVSPRIEIVVLTHGLLHMVRCTLDSVRIQDAHISWVLQ